MCSVLRESVRTKNSDRYYPYLKANEKKTSISSISMLRHCLGSDLATPLRYVLYPFHCVKFRVENHAWSFFHIFAARHFAVSHIENG